MRLTKAFWLFFLLFLFEPLITQPIAYADPLSDAVWILAPGDTLKVGKSFKMEVVASNTKILGKIRMNFAFKDTNLVRLDSISYRTSRLSNPTILNLRPSISPGAPDTITLEFGSSNRWNYLQPPDSGKIFDLWFFGIREGVFYIDALDSIQFWSETPPIIRPSLFTDSLVLRPHTDALNTDSFLVKKGVVYDTIGIKAKFPLPFTAYNDEILSGFQIPLFIMGIKGDNVPSFFDSITFEKTNLQLANTVFSYEDSSIVDTLEMIKLSLKKRNPTETLLDTVETGKVNKLLDLWLKADDSPGRCSIYTSFIPHFGDLFFIDSVGGFIPESYGVVCTTFSYLPGDITKNGVVNNVDLFYLAMYLFVPPEKTSSGKLSYNPEDLNRIKSQGVFELTQISSEEWDSTFSQILFRADVNGESRVDVGDYYIMSRYFQVPGGATLEFGWSSPKSVGLCNDDFVRINYRKAYPGQKIPILIEIYNRVSLAGLTLPLQIPDTTKIKCDSITLAANFPAQGDFDWEWMVWDEDYDQNTTNQDLLIIVSTLGTVDFPHIRASDIGQADSAFFLWCTVKDTLDTSDYIECVSLLPSHRISFFHTDTGYSCVPRLNKLIVDTVFADYGDAPDGTNPYFAPYSFPTLYNTDTSKIEGRRGPYHKDTTEWLGSLTDTVHITREWNAKIKDMDQDNLSDTLYHNIQGDTGWYIAPVTVTADPDTFRYLNVLYDVTGDKEWKKKGDTTEWVVQNKLIIPSGTTERIILGPFDIAIKPDSIPTWARFTLTRVPISAGEFGWDGSGPDTGWTYGETEDILFKRSKVLDSVYFSVNLDSSYEIPEGGEKVDILVKAVGGRFGQTIKDLALNWEVFYDSGEGDIVTCSLLYSYPLGEDTASFELKWNASITFTYKVWFPDPPNQRTSRVLWKVTKDLGAGTKLVATDEAEFVESAKPDFVFLDTLALVDTISYYGGVVDLSFFVVDPDGDYPILVTFDRGSFEGDTVVYSPIFGVLNDSTEIFDSKASPTHQVDSLYACSSNDTLIFHWAADTIKIGTRSAKFIAKETVGEQASIDTTLTIHVSDSDILKPPKDKVWVGRTGVVGQKGSYFQVPVEVYNKDSLNAIKSYFQIIGNIDTFLGWSFDSTTRLYPNYLTTRTKIPTPPVHTDTIVTMLYKYPDPESLRLAAGFGKVFDLLFKGDITSFRIDTLRSIEFLNWKDTKSYPDFESYEIRVIEKEGKCGDANGDGKHSVSDVIYIINYLFKGGPTPTPLEVADVNRDGKVSVSDVVYLINYLFKGGLAPCS